MHLCIEGWRSANKIIVISGETLLTLFTSQQKSCSTPNCPVLYSTILHCMYSFNVLFQWMWWGWPSNSVCSTMRTFLTCLVVIVVEGKRRTDPGENCPPNLCCKTNINGLYFSVCPTGYEGIVSIANHPIPSVTQSPIQIPNLYLHGQTNLGRNLPRSNDFTLKLLSINIWGFKWPMAEDKDLRVSKIVEFLRSSDYDIVFMQEAWMFSDFEKMKSVFPYSTRFGSPNSVFCPEIRWEHWS